MVQTIIRKFLPLVLTTFLSMSTSVSAISSRSRLVHNGLAKRFTGELLNDLSDLPTVFRGTRWTFYDAGLGACGATNDNKDNIVALNAIQFGVGYPGPQCFKKITMEYNGKKATATIVDMCPECPYGALDLSRGLFDYFASEDEGVIYGQWYFGESDSRRGGSNEGKHPPTPSKTKTKTRPSRTHAGVHTVPLLLDDPVRKPPGVGHLPTHVSEPTRFSRPSMNHSGNQQPAGEKNANLPSPAGIFPASNTGAAAARPNSKVIMGSELDSNTAILRPATSNAALKDTQLKSEYVSEDQSENLVAFNTIFGRLGSIAVAGSATNREE